jgi:hypothetical protein
MLRHLLLIFICCFISGVGFAQNTQSGIVFENKTRVVLQGIIIENPDNGKHALTDKAGNSLLKLKRATSFYLRGPFTGRIPYCLLICA